MTEQVNCPFCGGLTDTNAVKCSNCGALFKEPELPCVKFKELGPFVAIDLLTFGFFSTLWFFINSNAVNNLVENKKDSIKLNWLILLLAANGGFYLFLLYHNTSMLILSSIVQSLIYIALSYRVLRIVQKYTDKMYNVKLNFNPYYMVFFNVLYVVHFIETYTNRVYHTHEYFDWKSPQAVMLILLLLAFVFFIRFYNEIFLLLY